MALFQIVKIKLEPRYEILTYKTVTFSLFKHEPPDQSHKFRNKEKW